MRRVVCKSGRKGWRCRLRENYASIQEWRHYSAIYGLADRLGFVSAASAWAANPVIEGSVEPGDFRIVKVSL